MKRIVATLLVACGAPPGPTPIANIAPPDPAREPACETGTLAGIVLVKAGDTEPAIGATLVATRPTLEGERVVITDENGKFLLDKLDTHDTVVVYYEDRSFQAPLPRRCEAVTLEIDITTKVEPGTIEPILVK